MISKSEFQKALTGMDKARYREALAAVGVNWSDVFEALDENKDDLISFEEFSVEKPEGSTHSNDEERPVAAEECDEALMAPLTDAECAEMFALYDTNSDGRLQQSEVLAMIRAIKGSDDVDPVRVMQAWDYDGDGQVASP